MSRRPLVARGAANVARSAAACRANQSPPRSAIARELARLRGEPARPGPSSLRRRGPSGRPPGAGPGSRVACW
jgi:hypothetical protein